MNTIIDDILLEWMCRCEDGMPDINDPTKKSILNEILSEYGLDNINEAGKGALEAEDVLAICIQLQDTDIKKIFTDIKYAGTIEISGYNGASYLPVLTNYYNSYLKGSKNKIDTYTNICSEIKKLKIPKNARAVGNQYYSTTTRWIEYGGEKKVKGKSDILVGTGKRMDVSVKSGDTKVRILDGGPAQTKALVYSALDEVQFSKQVKADVEKIVNKLYELMNKTKMNTIFKGRNLSRQELRNLSDSDKNKASRELKRIFDEFMKNRNKAEKVFVDLINNITKDEKFKTKFIRESITGEIMFDDEGNSEGSAEYFLIHKEKLQGLKLLEITDKVVKKMAGSFSPPQIGIKSAGNQLLGRSLLQLNPDNELEEEINKLELYEEQLHELRLSTELTVINENIFTDLIDSIIEKGKVVIDNIINAFKNIYEKLKSAISIGIDAILEALGFELTIENINPELNITYDEL